MIKWIGQHIWDFVSRFRNDIYMESIPDGTIATGKNLGLDASNKVVKANVTGVSGNETTDNDITVTNTDDAFSHLASTINSNTTFTDVFELILSPYNRTTITLNKIGFQKESSAGSYAAEAYLVGDSTYVEAGQAFKINKLQYTVADASQTTDTSVDFRKALSNIQTGFTDSNTSLQSLSSSEVYANESVSSADGDSYLFNVVAVDDGGAGLGDQQIVSNYKTIYSYHRIKVGAYANAANSGLDTLGNATNAKTLYDNMTTALDAAQGKSNATITANSAMNDETKYTWIMYPSLWGELSNVYLLPGTPLGIGSDGAFLAKETYTFATDFGHDVEYYAYRSTITGAYNHTINQQIQLIF